MLWRRVAGSVGVSQWLHTGIICRFTHSSVWWLMLGVGRDLSLGRQSEHLHMTSPFGCLAPSQHGGWFPREHPREQGEVAWHIRLSFVSLIVLPCSLLLVEVIIKVHPGLEGGVDIDSLHHLKGGVSTSHYRKSIWDGICYCSHLQKT